MAGLQCRENCIVECSDRLSVLQGAFDLNNANICGLPYVEIHISSYRTEFPLHGKP